MSITVNSVPSISRKPVVVLSGQKAKNVTAIYVNDIDAGANFPTDTTWEVDYVLSSGGNTIFIKSKDDIGNFSPATRVDVNYPVYKQETESMVNQFDELGLMVGLNRIKGEKNVYFKNRIIDVYRNPGNANYKGLFNAIARELSIKNIQNAMTISVKKSSSGSSMLTGAALSIGSTKVRIEADQFFKTNESHIVDPATQRISLDKTPLEHTVKVIDSSGNEVKKSEWMFIDDDTIQVDARFSGQHLFFDYFHFEDVTTSGKTISQLKSDLENIKSQEGESYLSVSVNSSVASKSAENLEMLVPVGMISPVIIRYSDVKIRELGDPDYLDSFINSDGHAYNTDLQSFASKIISMTRGSWEQTILDVDSWSDDEGIDAGYEVLPSLWNPILGKWRCPTPNHDETFDIDGYTANNGKCPLDGNDLDFIGIPASRLKSIPAGSYSLKSGVIEKKKSEVFSVTDGVGGFS